jgi:hypothetical protein
MPNDLEQRLVLFTAFLHAIDPNKRSGLIRAAQFVFCYVYYYVQRILCLIKP